MSEPVYDKMTEVFYDRLPDIYRDSDADYFYHFKHYISAFAYQLQRTVDVYNRIDLEIESEGGDVGDSSDLLNPAEGDAKWLKWMAQVLGIKIDFYTDPDMVRRAIMPVPMKHTIAGLELLASIYLTNERRVRIVEGKEPNELSFVVHPDDLYWNALTHEQAVLAPTLLPLPDHAATTTNLFAISGIDEASFEGVGAVSSLSWAADHANLSLSNEAFAGVQSLLATVNADGTMTIQTPIRPLEPVVAQPQPYTATATVRCIGATQYRLYLRWYDAADDYIGQSAADEYFPSDDTWNTRYIKANAPIDAVGFRVVIASGTATMGDEIYIDRVGLVRGHRELWGVSSVAYDPSPHVATFPYLEDPLGWYSTPEGAAYLAAFGTSGADNDRAEFVGVAAGNNTGLIAWTDVAQPMVTTGQWLTPGAVQGVVTVMDKVAIPTTGVIRAGFKVKVPDPMYWYTQGAYPSQDPAEQLVGLDHTVIYEFYDDEDVLLDTLTHDGTQYGFTAKQHDWVLISSGSLAPPNNAVKLSVHFVYPLDQYPITVTPKTKVFFAEAEVVKGYTGTQNDWGDPHNNFNPTRIAQEGDYWQPWVTYKAYLHQTTWDSIKYWSDFIGTVVAHIKQPDNSLVPLYYNDWGAFEVMSGFLNSDEYIEITND